MAKNIVHVEYPSADFLLREKRGSGLVTLGLQFPGIPTAETVDNAGISSLVVRSTVRGAGGLTGEELADLVERLGGTVQTSVRADHLGWWITVPASRAQEAAVVLRTMAEEPNLAEADVDVERQHLASDVRRAQDDMFGYPVDRVLRLAFRDHAYGLPAIGTPESVDALEYHGVRDWAARVVTRRPVIVGVGDLPVGELADAIACLSSWPEVVDQSVPAVAPLFHGDHAFEERRKEQSALAMAFPAFAYGSSHRYALTVTASLLSGMAGRLFDELRERRSLAYTVAAIPWLARTAGVMLAYIATAPEREAEAREAMRAELRRVVSAPPNAEELERCRNYAAGGVEMRMQSGRSMAGEMLQAWINGTIEDVPNVPQQLRSVTVAEVVTIAERLFQDATPAEFVVRGVGRQPAAS